MWTLQIKDQIGITKSQPSDSGCDFERRSDGTGERWLLMQGIKNRREPVQSATTWQGMRDSNPRKRSQSPVCYRYTNPLWMPCVKTQVLLYRFAPICQAWISKNAEKINIVIFACQSRKNRREPGPVSYTHLRAHETGRNLVCRLLLEKKKT